MKQNPHNSGAYNTALWSFIIFLAHFAFERIAYNTVGGRGLLAAEILAFVTFCWMCYARGYYLEFGACLSHISDLRELTIVQLQAPTQVDKHHSSILIKANLFP